MDNIEAVQKIQDYIRVHVDDEGFSAVSVCSFIGYSRRHIDRLFKQYIGKTLYEYVNAVLLTKGADRLLNTKESVAEIAFDSHYQTHEGFTRSFYKRFSIKPSDYRDKKTAIPLFVQYPISHYYALLNNKEETTMTNDFSMCMITTQERPKRKLIYLPSKNGTDYLSYCQEIGCEWEVMLNSITEKIDTAALVELPGFLVEEGYSKVAAGIEVPMDYDKPLPENYKTAELDECIMIYFQSEPYEKGEDFGKAIESVYKAIERYTPSLYGYKFAYDIAPCFNFGADTEKGARLAVPAVKIK